MQQLQFLVRIPCTYVCTRLHRRRTLAPQFQFHLWRRLGQYEYVSKIWAGPTLFRYRSWGLSALRKISKQKTTISSTKIRKTVGLKKNHTHTLPLSLESGFKKIRFCWTDSLISFGQKGDASKKRLRFQKYPDACGRGLSFPRGCSSSDEGYDNIKNAIGYLSKCIKTEYIRKIE